MSERFDWMTDEKTSEPKNVRRIALIVAGSAAILVASFAFSLSIMDQGVAATFSTVLNLVDP